MNKIKRETYLYKEVISGLKSSYIKSIFVIKNNDKDRLKKKVIYMVSPNIRENKELYLKLFKDKADYIYIDNYNLMEYNLKKIMRSIRISDGTKIYISLKHDISEVEFRYICMCIAISLADFVVINKISSISDGMKELDIALDFGKEIYAIPGDIFDYKNYLSNFAIKQGAIPICSLYDVKNIK